MLARLDLIDLLLEVSVGLQEIQAAIEIVIKEEEAKAQHPAADRADSLSNRLVAEKLTIFRYIYNFYSWKRI